MAKPEVIGSNISLLHLTGQDEVFYSYYTPVAGFKSGLGYFRTANYYSVTTSRHINKYLRSSKLSAKVLPQAEINAMIAGGLYA